MRRAKFALIGDEAANHYTVAERLWELLSAVSGVSFTYEVIPMASELQVLDFFQAFKQKAMYRGFNIGTPWKGVLAEVADKAEPLCSLPIFNTIYKDSGRIVGVNTDPLAAQKAVEHTHNLYKCSSALVLSTNGSGLPIADHLQRELNIATFLYDASVRPSERIDITYLNSLDGLATRTYDLVVNATPLGRYYFDKGIEAFSSPLSLELLRSITHANSIIQETNYLPAQTLLLQMAQSLGRPTVTGELMLVFRANESLKRFCDVSLDEHTLAMVMEEMRLYIAEREAAIWKLCNAEQRQVV